MKQARNQKQNKKIYPVLPEISKNRKHVIIPNRPAQKGDFLLVLTVIHSIASRNDKCKSKPPSNVLLQKPLNAKPRRKNECSEK